MDPGRSASCPRRASGALGAGRSCATAGAPQIGMPAGIGPRQAQQPLRGSPVRTGDEPDRARRTEQFGGAVRAPQQLGRGPRVEAGRVVQLVAPVVAAGDAGVSTIVTAFAPVGPTAQALARLAPDLALAGITLVQVRRDWDEAFWPLATKGFFAFKDRIPAVLAELGVS